MSIANNFGYTIIVRSNEVINLKGSITKKIVSGKTRYYIVVDVPHRKGEKRKQKWIAAGTSYRQAESMLPKILLEVQSSSYGTGQHVLFINIVDDYLFSNKQRLASSTYKRYEGIAKALTQYFEMYTVKEIEPYIVDQYFKSLIKKGYSMNTIAKYRVVLSQIFAYAQELKLIDTIPIPKLKHKGTAENYLFQVWDSKEVNDFLLCVKDSPIYLPTFIAVRTGMRLGEILALKWSAIDFDKQQLTVRYAVDVEGKLKTTKTKQSRRVIKLTPEVLSLLKETQHQQKISKLQYGSTYYKNDFVCTFENGKPLSRNYVSTTFRRKVKKYKMPVIRFHDLRHTFATIALSHNVHVKVVQEILGHASSRTTLDVYSHVMPTMQEQSLEILSRAFES